MDSFDINSLFLFDGNRLLGLIISLIINIAVLMTVIICIYKKHNSNREYIFTYGIFNIIIFLICYLLSSATLSIGFSFGLFAIFSILRYRTVPIPIKEMTYFFLAISIAIINSLSINTIGFVELIVANVSIISFTMLFEKFWTNQESMKYIRYERIELVKPEFHEELLSDLRSRTGLLITRLEVGKIDFLRDIAEIRIFYKSNNGHFVNVVVSDDDDDD